MDPTKVDCGFCAKFATAHPETIRAANAWHAFVSEYTGMAPACSAAGQTNRVVSEYVRRMYPARNADTSRKS